MDMNEQQLLEICREACAAAVAAGASHADTIVQTSRGVSIEIEKNSIRAGETAYDAGYCVRAFRNGGSGFARGNSLDISTITKAAKTAAAMAGECESDPDFKDLPYPAPLGNVDGLYDRTAAEFEPARAIELCMKCIDTARNIAPDVIAKGDFNSGYALTAVANSNGVAFADLSSFISYYLFSVVRKGDRVGSYYEYTHGRRIETLKTPEDVAREATERAISFIDSKKMETGEYPVILGPVAASGFIRSVIGAASAEEIQRGRSYLAGKRGEKIASDILTITEDPLFPAGLMSSAADGEGVPRLKRNILDAGTLTLYLHNSYTANKSGEKNTGHASRASYNSSVGISASNISVTPGSRPENDLISGIKDGLYIFMGSISPNNVTGQISGTVDFGFRIINGELAYPVENVMVGGDVFDFLSSIVEISSDYRDEPGNMMPSLLFGKVRVAGA